MTPNVEQEACQRLSTMRPEGGLQPRKGSDDEGDTTQQWHRDCQNDAVHDSGTVTATIDEGGAAGQSAQLAWGLELDDAWRLLREVGALRKLLADTQRRCGWCGARFEVRRSGHPRIYCDKRCAQTAAWHRAAERKAAASPEVVEARERARKQCVACDRWIYWEPKRCIDCDFWNKRARPRIRSTSATEAMLRALEKAREAARQARERKGASVAAAAWVAAQGAVGEVAP